MKRLLGLLLIVVSAISFGAMPIFARLAYESGADPVTVLFLRFAIAAALMSLIMAWRGIGFPRGRTLLGLVFLGAVCFVGQSLSYFTALTMASAGLVALLLYLHPALVTIFAVLLFKEPLTKTKIAALVLALTGTGFIIGLDGGGRPVGILLGVTSAVIYTVYILVGSRITKRAAAVASSTVIMLSAAFVYGCLVAVQGPRLPATSAGWLSIFAIALVSTVLAVVTFFAGLERIGPTNTATISTLEPVVVVILAALVLRETVTPLRIVGGVMILAAVIVLAKSELNASRNRTLEDEERNG